MCRIIKIQLTIAIINASLVKITAYGRYNYISHKSII